MQAISISVSLQCSPPYFFDMRPPGNCTICVMEKSYLSLIALAFDYRTWYVHVNTKYAEKKIGIHRYTRTRMDNTTYPIDKRQELTSVNATRVCITSHTWYYIVSKCSLYFSSSRKHPFGKVCTLLKVINEWAIHIC